MSLRIGVDLDGTLADLSRAYHEYEQRLFGDQTTPARIDDVDDDAAPKPPSPADAKLNRRRNEAVWQAIKNTSDFWASLEPEEDGAVRVLYDAAMANRWEIFFITQRPPTKGETVQLQSQRWLIAQGFATPSVLTLSGSRGKAAHALDLDFLIDDLPKNCIDVLSDSKCQPILIVRDANPIVEASARRLKVAVVPSVVEAIGLLTQPKDDTRATLVSRILLRLGLVR